MMLWILPGRAALNQATHSRTLSKPFWTFIHKKDIMVWPAAGGMDVKHAQAVGAGRESVRGSRRQPQEIADLQGILLTVENGAAAAGQHEIVFLRNFVIADVGASTRIDVNAIDGAGGFLVGLDQGL